MLPSFSELAIIFLLILVVMGPEKLPEVARWAGKGLRELRQASNTLRDALMLDEFDDIRNTPKRIADSARQKPLADSPKLKKAKSTPAPRTTPSKPARMDQVDDDDFHRMLQEKYRSLQTELHPITLAIKGPGLDTVTVDLPERGVADGVIAVVLPDPPVTEAAW